MKRNAPLAAAFVNSSLVLLAPIAFGVIAIDGGFGRDHTVIAAPVRTLVISRLIGVVFAVLVCVPFAAVVGWRTWVHAQEYCAARSNGWRGVAESTSLGLILPTLALFRIILVKPGQSAPYVIAYSAISALVGFAIGLLLWLSAVIVLRLAGCRSAKTIA